MPTRQKTYEVAFLNCVPCVGYSGASQGDPEGLYSGGDVDQTVKKLLHLVRLACKSYTEYKGLHLNSPQRRG